MKITPQTMPVSAATSLKTNRLADGAKTAGSFQAMLEGALQQVNELQLNAEATANSLAAGGDIDFHQVSVAAEKANLSLQLTVQIRNKIIEAYQEIMRMQV